ncbi:glycosyltransferase [candidate division WOR-3 bacterium]|nr:glycosyltransferase [candidate division WOR-3 bacterium]
MNILVLTSIERAFYSSIIEYQLLEPIIEVNKHTSHKFIYLGLIPLAFWVSRREPVKSFKEYRINRKRIKKWLNENEISCFFIPILFPIRHKDFYLRILWLVLYTITTYPILVYFLFRYKIDFIHSRNYPATWLTFILKSWLGIPYNFDMRDLYPEKGIEAGIFTDPAHKFMCGAWSYRLWKFLEQGFIKSASHVITTSEPFKEYVATKLKCSKVNLIPNCVNPKRFKPDGEKREELRIKYGIQDKFVLIHSGAFGTPKDLPLTLKYFLHFKKVKPNAKLVILCGTKKNLPKILQEARKLDINSSDFILLSPKPDEVPELLLLGDAGLHLESMAIATPYCISVKDGEYLATGLPIIVTLWLKGIAPLIEKYDVGIVVNPLEIGSTSARGGLPVFSEDNKNEIYFLKNYKRLKKNSSQLVNEVLSLEIAVRKLLEIYK